MKKLLLAVAALVTCGLLSTPANASPAFVYAFHTESVDGILCSDEPDQRGCLFAFGIVLEQSAVRRGHATLLIQAGLPDGSPPSFYNDGFVFTDYCSESTGFCHLAIELDGISAFLSGSFDLQDNETSIQISGADRDWSGRAGSDHYWFGGPPFELTGYYKLARVIPEPGFLALLGVGLVGFAFTRRREQSNADH